MYRIYAKDFYVFCLYVSKLLKIKKIKCYTKDTYQVSTVIGWLDSEISCRPFLKT
ncbi:hypothetical protein E2986_14030 [Frieseomelitta varia]|uniref:Uncharacterized protein n=1 Tax=Frieseomelitta varia TaxID=561572 RepID=A0A833SAP5_9HYME|nr:hypothetical protein E2986_14030 [Frieseomelitta varia]